MSTPRELEFRGLRFSADGMATVIRGERASDVCVVWAWPCDPYILNSDMGGFNFSASAEFRAAVNQLNEEAIASGRVPPSEGTEP